MTPSTSSAAMTTRTSSGGSSPNQRGSAWCTSIGTDLAVSPASPSARRPQLGQKTAPAGSSAPQWEQASTGALSPR
jgi:hypothetical protein